MTGGRGGGLDCEACDRDIAFSQKKTQLNSRTSKPRLVGCTLEEKFKTMYSLVIYWCKICNKCKTGISTYVSQYVIITSNFTYLLMHERQRHVIEKQEVLILILGVVGLVELSL